MVDSCVVDKDSVLLVNNSVLEREGNGEIVLLIIASVVSVGELLLKLTVSIVVVVNSVVSVRCSVVVAC